MRVRRELRFVVFLIVLLVILLVIVIRRVNFSWNIIFVSLLSLVLIGLSFVTRLAFLFVVIDIGVMQRGPEFIIRNTLLQPPIKVLVLVYFRGFPGAFSLDDVAG